MSSNEDAQGDGIINPPAINGNNTVATYSDDDGGYLRLRATDFYANGALAI
jgi:hypothetical protein